MQLPQVRLLALFRRSCLTPLRAPAMLAVAALLQRPAALQAATAGVCTCRHLSVGTTCGSKCRIGRPLYLTRWAQK